MTVVFRGSLLADGGRVEVLVTSETGGLRLTSPGAGTWLIPHGEERKVGGAVETWAVSHDPVENVRRVLELACRGRFCLHAAAVRIDDTRVVAFVGESGSGKSTLARRLEERTGGRWPRVADDALPAWVGRDEIIVDGLFPQPSLGAGEQYRGVDGRSLTLAAVYVLRRPDDPATPVGSRRLRPFESVAAIAGNTMSARLFDRRLLDSHLGFSRDVAARVPVRELCYPHRPGAVMETLAVVGGDLEASVPRAGSPDGA